MRILLPILIAASLQAAVDGVVRNGTTGKPQAGASVTLVTIGGTGMEPQGSVKTDASGRFRFEQTPQANALVQATHQDVTYSMMIQPGAATSGLTLDVYDATPTPGDAKVTEDVVLLEPSGSQLSVRQNVIWRNGGSRTFRDRQGGTLRIYAPPEAKDTLRVSATPPGGLPLDEAAVPAGPKNIYKVDFPIRPGDTTFEVGYSVPFTTPGTFSGRTLQKDVPLRLAVPAGVSLTGEGLTLMGQEPQSQASVYGVKTQEYKVEIQGTGSMGQAPAAAEGGSDSGLDQILPRVYDNAYQIVGLGLAVLALGFVLLYRMKATPSSTAQEPAAPRSRHRR